MKSVWHGNWKLETGSGKTFAKLSRCFNCTAQQWHAHYGCTPTWKCFALLQGEGENVKSVGQQTSTSILLLCLLSFLKCLRLRLRLRLQFDLQIEMCCHCAQCTLYAGPRRGHESLPILISVSPGTCCASVFSVDLFINWNWGNCWRSEASMHDCQIP